LATRLLVRFEGEAGASHEFTFTSAAHDLARSDLRRLGTPFGTRRFHYLHHGQAYRVEPGRADSEPMDGPTRLELVRQVALRRAVYLWPRGLSWQTGEGSGRCRCDLGEAGRLEATLAGGDLQEATSFDALGRACESLRVLRRTSLRGRDWPAQVELRVDDRLVWTEELVAAESSVHCLDLFFLPADRRPALSLAAEALPPGEQARIIDVPPRWTRRIVLPGAADPAQARASAGVCWERERTQAATLGLTLEPSVGLGLDAEGRPAELWLRAMREPSATPLEGWELVGERSAVVWFTARPLDWSGAAARDALARLKRGLPSQASSTTPYWVVEGELLSKGTDPVRLQLVLPFQVP
jgi:hypothetical protein